MVVRPTLDDRMRKALLELLKASRKPFTLRVRGESMLPALATDDEVRVTPCTAPEIEIGEIVAYHADRGIAVHRVLRRVTRDQAVKLYQAGDNLQGGSWLTDNQVVGKVTAVIRSNTDGKEPSGALTRRECWGRYAQIRVRELVSRLLACFTPLVR
ncbi:MAG: S24/S26 family peptidase [Acidobacteriota bacterium]